MPFATVKRQSKSTVLAQKRITLRAKRTRDRKNGTLRSLKWKRASCSSQKIKNYALSTKIFRRRRQRQTRASVQEFRNSFLKEYTTRKRQILRSRDLQRYMSICLTLTKTMFSASSRFLLVSTTKRTERRDMLFLSCLIILCQRLVRILELSVQVRELMI